MLFNSIDFAIYLPIVFVLYWFVFSGKIKLQNLLIVVASYVFYGWWDWRFLTLIFFSSALDFWVGLKIYAANDSIKRKYLLWLSLIVNLGFLGFFKYYNFFLDNIVSAFTFFGYDIGVRSLNVILPVGISFYTFQTLSYSIDIYKGRLKPTDDFIAFAAFVSFFPQLVAGPIERASHLLPQFAKPRFFDDKKAIDGMKQILWGLFKKIVIADTCAIFADDIFQNYEDYSGLTLIFGAILFSFQIYGDFSGYSDIAIGVAKLFSFDLMTNFRTPYFSRNIAEFWRRWHISLSTWFRDYVYIPLGGSKVSTIKAIRNVFVIFVLSGFWHGANWTYIVWGALNALYFIPSFILKTNRKYVLEESRSTFSQRAKELFDIGFTFVLTVLAWVFFRSKTVGDAMGYLTGVINSDNFLTLKTKMTYEVNIRPLLFYILLFIGIEWYYRKSEIMFVVSDTQKSNVFLRYSLYVLVCMCILLSVKNQANSFIYFQF